MLQAVRKRRLRDVETTGGEASEVRRRIDAMYPNADVARPKAWPIL